MFLDYFFSKFYNTRVKCNLENQPEENYPLESKIDFKKTKGRNEFSKYVSQSRSTLTKRKWKSSNGNLTEIISLKILNPELIHFDEMTTNQPLVSLRKLNKFHMKVITL